MQDELLIVASSLFRYFAACPKTRQYELNYVLQVCVCFVNHGIFCAWSVWLCRTFLFKSFVSYIIISVCSITLFLAQDKGILLTTYDIVRTSSKALRGDSYLVEYEDYDDFVWDYVILDEVSFSILVYCNSIRLTLGLSSGVSHHWLPMRLRFHKFSDI